MGGKAATTLMGEMTDIDGTSIVIVMGDRVAEVIPLVAAAVEAVARGGRPQDNVLEAAGMGSSAPPAIPVSATGPRRSYSLW